MKNLDTLAIVSEGTLCPSLQQFSLNLQLSTYLTNSYLSFKTQLRYVFWEVLPNLSTLLYVPFIVLLTLFHCNLNIGQVYFPY